MWTPPSSVENQHEDGHPDPRMNNKWDVRSAIRSIQKGSDMKLKTYHIFRKKKILSLTWMAIVAGVHIQHNQVKNYPKRKHTTFCQTWSSLPLVAASTRFGVWKNGHLQQWSFKSLMTMWIFLVNTSGNLVPFFESDERVIILEYAWISYAFNFVCKKSVRKTHAIGKCWNVHGIYNLWYLSPGWHHILGLGHFYHALPLLGRVCMSQ